MRLTKFPLVVLCLLLTGALIAAQSAADLTQVEISKTLLTAVNYPGDWRVLPLSDSAGIRLSNGGTSYNTPRPTDSYLTISGEDLYDLSDGGRIINSVDAAWRIASLQGNVLQQELLTLDGRDVVLAEFGQADEAEGAVLVSPWDDSRYSVAVLESGSPEQYSADRDSALAIFGSLRPAENSELVEGLSPETMLDSDILSQRVTANGYSVFLPEGYQSSTAMAAGTGALSLGFLSTANLGLDYYGMDGEIGFEPYPMVVVAPDLGTGFLTALGAQTRPRFANVGGRYALVTEGFSAGAFGNYINVTVRLDNGSFYSVLGMTGAETPMTNAARQFTYGVAALLDSNQPASADYRNQSVFFDMKTGADVLTFNGDAGAPQVLGFGGQPEGSDLSLSLIYGDAEGDASAFKLALVSSDNPRTPAGAVINLTNSPEQQQRGFASLDFTWFCDFRTFDALYVLGVEDSSGNLSAPMEVNIRCGGSAPSVTLLGNIDEMIADLGDQVGLGPIETIPLVDSGTISVGETITLTDVVGEYHQYFLEVEAGESYEIIGSSAESNVSLMIFDEDGREITRDYDTSAGMDSTITFVPETSGTYGVVASSFRRDELTLSVRVLSGSSETGLAMGQTIENLGTKTYDVEAGEGELISLRVLSDDSFNLELQEDGRTFVEAMYFDPDVSLNVVMRAPAEVTYQFVIHSMEEELEELEITPDPYLYQLERPVIDDVIPVFNRDRVMGYLNLGDSLSFSYQAQAGERVRVIAESRTFDPVVEVKLGDRVIDERKNEDNFEGGYFDYELTFREAGEYLFTIQDNPDVGYQTPQVNEGDLFFRIISFDGSSPVYRMSGAVETVTRASEPTPTTIAPTAAAPATVARATATPAQNRLQSTAVVSAASTPVSCPNLMQSRMIVGGRGRVVIENGNTSNRMRNGAGLNFSEITRIPPGGEFDVLRGPECRDGYAWWLVRYGGFEGWTAESGDNEYWIEMIQTGSAATTGSGECYAYADDANVNLRRGPGTNRDIGGELRRGSQIQITGKRVNNSGRLWYKLQNGLWVRNDVIQVRGDCASIPDV